MTVFINNCNGHLNVGNQLILTLYTWVPVSQDKVFKVLGHCLITEKTTGDYCTSDCISNMFIEYYNAGLTFIGKQVNPLLTICARLAYFTLGADSITLK